MRDTYYIYLLKDVFDNCIYVGKTKNLKSRISSHISKTQVDKCIDKDAAIEQNRKAEEINKVYYAECANGVDASIYEIYYISKFQPIYNTEFKSGVECTLNLKELDFKEYGVKINPNARIKVNTKEKSFRLNYSESNMALIEDLFGIKTYPGLGFKYTLDNVEINIVNYKLDRLSKEDELKEINSLVSYINKSK